MPVPIRVGAVSYLNAKPLYYRLTEFAPGISLEMDLPSRLADRLAEGELDVALIPSVEYLRGAVRGYEIIPGFAIAAEGAVRSVKLFSRVPIESIRTLALDAGSRTSVALTRVLLAERHGLHPELKSLPVDDSLADTDADAVHNATSGDPREAPLDYWIDRHRQLDERLHQGHAAGPEKNGPLMPGCTLHQVWYKGGLRNLRS